MASTATIAKKIRAVQVILAKHRVAVKERIVHDTKAAAKRIADADDKKVRTIRTTIASS